METTTVARPMLILVAGPYRSGTNDDPQRIEKNVTLMSEIALAIHNMGHVPILGEWIALPLIEQAGSKHIGDDIFNDIFNPTSVKLLSFCSAVLRVGGPSVGADEMVNIGRELHKFIFTDINQIPSLISL